MPDNAVISVEDETRVSAARRLSATLCRQLEMDSTENGKVAIIVTELAANLARHAGGGEIVIRLLENENRPGVEILALDRGPGIRNISECIRDGYSTYGGQGQGLGAVMRLSSEFDFFSQQGKGVAVVSRVWKNGIKPDPRFFSTGAVCLPKQGETACGDAWAHLAQPGKSLVFVADGLGHGPDAAAASAEAVRLFRKHHLSTPAEIMQYVHNGLRKTRGAAVAVAEVDHDNAVVRYVGCGNIAGCICNPGKARNMVSHNGIVGLDVRKIQEYEYPWPEGSLLIMHSDGMATRWTMDDYPGLAAKDTSLVAGVLYRDWKRGNDDITVVVAREGVFSP